MKIYIDDDFKCHVTDDGKMRAAETDFFNEKCVEFIEGYRFIPEGETWIRDDGMVFIGEMISPWKPYSELAAIQSAVDHTQAAADEEISTLLDTIEGLIIGG